MPGAARPFLLCARAVAVLTVLAGLSDATAFARVLGPVPPLAAVVSAMLAGAAALALIQRRNWFAAGPRTGSVRAAFIGAVFAVPTVALDLAWPFDSGFNVSLPVAAAFYPAIGFVAEVAFHLVPLAFLLALMPRGTTSRLPVLVVAAIEPAYQAAHGDALPRDAIVAAWLYAFGLYQLAIFRSSGFVALYSARLGYYAVWHIAWGALRLPVLFGPA